MLMKEKQLTDCLDICTSACLRSGRSSRRGWRSAPPVASWRGHSVPTGDELEYWFWVDLTDLSGLCFGHIVSSQITCLLAVRMAGGPIPVEYVFGGVDEFSVLVAGLPGSKQAMHS